MGCLPEISCLLVGGKAHRRPVRMRSVSSFTSRIIDAAIEWPPASVRISEFLGPHELHYLAALRASNTLETGIVEESIIHPLHKFIIE